MERLTQEQVQALNAPAQTVSLEQFKSAVEQNLIRVAGQSEAVALMTEYDSLFPQFYKENWSVAAITPALEMRAF